MGQDVPTDRSDRAYLRGMEDEPGMKSDVLWDQSTFPAALKRCVSLWGDRELLVFSGRRLPMQAFARELERLIGGLLSLGVRRGDHVAVWLTNIAEYAVIEFAIAALGASMVPVNIRYKKEEVEYTLRHSDSSTLLLMPMVLKTDSVAMLRQICPELNAGGGFGASKALPKLKNVVVIGAEVPGTKSYEEVLSLGDAVPEARRRQCEETVRPEDIVILQYTSGTTAFPKAAMLSQGQTLRNAFQMATRSGFNQEDRVVSAMPMFHVGGSVCALLGAITVGYTLYTSPNFDATETLRLIEEEQITAFVGLEPMYLALRNDDNFTRYSHASLRKGWTAGTPSILRMVAEQVGIRHICSLYGLSEASPNVSISHWQDDSYEKRIGTMGRPQPGVEVKIVDSLSGETLKREMTGEICVRGWTVMKGYYNDPEATSKALDTDHWLHTGDAGYVSQDGYLIWTGRIKDTIRVGGENVSAVEVEHVLCTHPKVVAAALVGAPDSRLQEVGMAFVQLKAGEDTTEQEIIDYCRERLAIFKVPKYVRFVSQFQTTGSGKIQKFLLREQTRQEFGQNVR